jgi:AcrR family transcriptional regulator
VSSPSDAPVRAPGSHTRSGNSMLRTRAAILAAAEACVARVGVRRTTMSEVCAAGGIAKATLYNHFRAKNDLLEGLALARVDELAARAVAGVGGGLAEALQLVAVELAASPALHRIRAEEPEVVAIVACPGTGRVWDAARAGVAGVLVAAGRPADDDAVDLVLRWLVGQAAAPADDALLAGGARLLSAAVMTASPGHTP